ncbi:hypothetical protein C0993_005720 [Termitomyces sp. T159_Od127]|nr:hypothetical protein C0993_005720 [Termitomyces sp. T159_Od127]
MSIFYPSSSSSIPWLEEVPNDGHEFASNKSLVPSQRPHVVLNKSVKPNNAYDDRRGPSSEDRKDQDAMVGRSEGHFPMRTPGTVRKGPDQNIFHDCSSRLLPPFPSLSFLEPPSELPQPTPPYHSRAKFRRRTWLLSLLSRFRFSRLLAQSTCYLALYFTLNLALTLYNKSVLISFPFPYALSALHAFCGAIGSTILVRTGSTPVPRLNTHEKLILLAFSGLYTVNITVSNVSLGLVTVPVRVYDFDGHCSNFTQFHQVVRAATPFFTIIFSALILGTKSSHLKLLALLPVVAGVGFATYGDYYATPWGFLLTLLGTVLASLKTVYTNFLQAPSSSIRSSKQNSEKPTAVLVPSPRHSKLPPLTPLHLLYLLSPLAFIESLILAYLTGELGHVFESVQPHIFTRSVSSSHLGMQKSQLVLLAINGVLAFSLNVVSFSTNRKVGALSMTVAANVKQVLTILCAVAMFNLTITPTNAVGILLTLIGGAMYTSVELREKREQS